MERFLETSTALMNSFIVTMFFTVSPLRNSEFPCKITAQFFCNLKLAFYPLHNLIGIKKRQKKKGTVKSNALFWLSDIIWWNLRQEIRQAITRPPLKKDIKFSKPSINHSMYLTSRLFEAFSPFLWYSRYFCVNGETL